MPRLRKHGGLEVCAEPLSGGAYALGLFNRGESSGSQGTPTMVSAILELRDLDASQ